MKKTLVNAIILVIAAAAGALRAQAPEDVALQWQRGAAGGDCSLHLDEQRLELESPKLGGRLFMFYGTGYHQPYANLTPGEVLDYILWQGATDVVNTTGGSGKFGHMSSMGPQVPPPLFAGPKKNDPFTPFLAECDRRGVPVWQMMHGNVEDRVQNPAIVEAHKEFYAYDDAGRAYGRTGDNRHGGAIDILSERGFQYRLVWVDFILEKVKPYKCFQGFLFDEFWFNYMVNFFQPYFPEFAAWCHQEFGETPPDEIRKKIGERGKWHELDNIWWRRYVLWREKIIFDFENKLIDYIHSKGYKVITQRMDRGIYPRNSSWQYGSGIRAFTQGDFAMSARKENEFMGERAVGGVWYGPQTLNHQRFITGSPITVFEIQQSLYCNPKMLEKIPYKTDKIVAEIYKAAKTSHNNPQRLDLEWAVLGRNSRRWQPGTSLARTAVLTHDRANIFTALNPGDIESRCNAPLLDKLPQYRPVMRLDAEFPEYFARFQTLVTAGPPLQYLSPESYRALCEFIENGGTLLAVEPVVKVGRPDGSNSRDCTAELFGFTASDTPIFPLRIQFAQDSPVAPGMTLRLRGQSGKINQLSGACAVASMSSSAGTAPAITVKKMGKGQAAAIHFPIHTLIAAEENGVWLRVLAEILDQLSPNPVALQGDVRAMTAVTKDGDLGITLAPVKSLPASGTIKIAPECLSRKNYTVCGRAFGYAKPIHSPSGQAVWTAAEISRGIPVTVTAEREFELIEIEGR